MTSKPHFIFLTTDRSQAIGAKVRFNASSIMTYGPSDDPARRGQTWVECADPYDIRHVLETPEQIDAMLGVTEDRVLAAVPKMIAAMEMAREYMSDWTGGKPCLDALDDALSQATGTTSPASQDGADHTDLLKRARLYVESCAEGDPESKAAALLSDMDAALQPQE